MTIEVEHLSKSFTTGRAKRRTSIEAVHDISFSVAPGERLAYIGPNGAGKSTSIKMLTGILHPSAGTASVLGLVPWKHRKQLARRIGTLFGQRSQLWFELTATQSFRMLGAIFGLSDAQLANRVAELGELLEATDVFHMPVRSMSLGQRMRCELAACMLHTPEILFLDEPTIGLDLLGKQLFRDLIVRVNEERGTTVVLTSHDVADIECVARRVIVINHGSVIYDDDVEVMRRSLFTLKRIEVGLERPVETCSIPGAIVTEHTPTVIRLVVDTSLQSIRDVVDAVLDQLPVADLSIVDPPLDEVIASIYTSARA
jgi:ABC-2 type transport system ATP-binding protein